jgi:hypothetical protein
LALLLEIFRKGSGFFGENFISRSGGSLNVTTFDFFATLSEGLFDDEVASEADVDMVRMCRWS